MADTTILKYKVEPWIRDTWLPKQPEFSGIKFTSCDLPLHPGGGFKGKFEFDAVDASKTIAVCISANRKNSGVIHKIRADMLFLLLADVKRRIVVVTNKILFEHFEQERRNGRVPEKIQFLHAQLPRDLQKQVDEVWEKSSKEQRKTQ